MNAPLLDRIRQRCAQVAERATHATIDRARIAEYAATLPIDRISTPKLDPAHHFLGPVDDTIAFVLTLDTINFGSGYFPHLQKLPGLSGYFTIATHLTDHFRSRGPIPADELTNFTLARCRDIFHQRADDGPVDELMGLFARALKDLGRFVRSQFAGDFTAVVAAASGSAQMLAETLARMDFFRDSQKYGALEIPFYKRAQLTAADLALAIPDHPLGKFSDLNRLTIFADNLVPHVLRIDGILRYTEELVQRIESGTLIPRGSMEEIEIRAGAVHASELIVSELRKLGHDTTAMQLDYLLWNRGQEPKYKAHPRHRTRTVYY